MTLLERWDDSHTETMQWAPDEIRRAIAIAQVVDEFSKGELRALSDPFIIAVLNDRADELLEGKPETYVPCLREGGDD